MSIAFFQHKGHSIAIVYPRDIKLELSIEDMQSKVLHIPLNLAVHNADNDPLEVVKIVIQYPPELKIRSSAQRGILLNENSIVYEHEIGTLDQVAHLTPLKDIDVLELPYQYLPVHVATLTADGGSYVQIISVTGQNRHIILDENTDGKLELEFWDTNRDGVMDTKYIPPVPQMTIDWLKEAVEK